VSFKFLLSCSRFATLKYLFLSNSASKDLICVAVNAVRGLFFLSSSLIAVTVFSWTSLSTLVVEFAPLLLVHASGKTFRFLYTEMSNTNKTVSLKHKLFTDLPQAVNNRMYQQYDDTYDMAKGAIGAVLYKCLFDNRIHTSIYRKQTISNIVRLSNCKLQSLQASLVNGKRKSIQRDANNWYEHRNRIIIHSQAVRRGHHIFILLIAFEWTRITRVNPCRWMRADSNYPRGILFLINLETFFCTPKLFIFILIPAYKTCRTRRCTACREKCLRARF